jgi:AcrR family transcriptional regulator
MSLQPHSPSHPGELIHRTYIEPYDSITIAGIARELGVNKSTFSRLIGGKVLYLQIWPSNFQLFWAALQRVGYNCKSSMIYGNLDKKLISMIFQGWIFLKQADQ